MNVVPFNSKNKHEATQKQCNDVVHVRPSNTIGGGNSEKRKQKERCYGGDWHRHSLG